MFAVAPFFIDSTIPVRLALRLREPRQRRCGRYLQPDRRARRLAGARRRRQAQARDRRRGAGNSGPVRLGMPANAVEAELGPPEAIGGTSRNYKSSRSSARTSRARRRPRSPSTTRRSRRRATAIRASSSSRARYTAPSLATPTRTSTATTRTRSWPTARLSTGKGQRAASGAVRGPPERLVAGLRDLPFPK